MQSLNRQPKHAVAWAIFAVTARNANQQMSVAAHNLGQPLSGENGVGDFGQHATTNNQVILATDAFNRIHARVGDVANDIDPFILKYIQVSYAAPSLSQREENILVYPRLELLTSSRGAGPNVKHATSGCEFKTV